MCSEPWGAKWREQGGAWASGGRWWRTDGVGRLTCGRSGGASQGEIREPNPFPDSAGGTGVRHVSCMGAAVRKWCPGDRVKVLDHVCSVALRAEVAGTKASAAKARVTCHGPGAALLPHPRRLRTSRRPPARDPRRPAPWRPTWAGGCSGWTQAAPRTPPAWCCGRRRRWWVGKPGWGGVLPLGWEEERGRALNMPRARM